MNILRESMTRVETVWFVVRVWRQEPDLKTPPDNADMAALIRELVHEVDGKQSPTPLAEKILRLERVNAVEVLDMHGNGTVLYRDWP